MSVSLTLIQNPPYTVAYNVGKASYQPFALTGPSKMELDHKVQKYAFTIFSSSISLLLWVGRAFRFHVIYFASSFKEQLLDLGACPIIRRDPFIAWGELVIRTGRAFLRTQEALRWVFGGGTFIPRYQFFDCLTSLFRGWLFWLKDIVSLNTLISFVFQERGIRLEPWQFSSPLSRLWWSFLVSLGFLVSVMKEHRFNKVFVGMLISLVIAAFFSHPIVNDKRSRDDGNILCSHELNVTHFQKGQPFSVNKNIDLEVWLDKLLVWFEEVNCTDPAKPGYINPKKNADFEIDREAFSKEQLREGLVLHNDHLRKRCPFLATPAALHLKEWYEQWEMVFRWNMESLCRRGEQYTQTYGPLNHVQQEGTDGWREQREVMEERNRYVNDTAIATKRCAIRQIEEDLGYARLFQSTNRVGSVEDNGSDISSDLYNRLAQKREDKLDFLVNANQYGLHPNDIANPHLRDTYKARVRIFWGLDEDPGVTPNGYDDATFKKIVEAFFVIHYTPHSVIGWVKEWMKDSLFRDHLYDWIKGQVGDWNQEKYICLYRELLGQIVGINSEGRELSSDRNEALFFLSKFLSFLGKEPSVCPVLARHDLDEKFLLEEIWSLKEVKEWVMKNTNFVKKTDRLHEELEHRNECRRKFFSEDSLGDEGITWIRNALLNPEGVDLGKLQDILLKEDKMTAFKKILAQRGVSEERQFLEGIAAADKKRLEGMVKGIVQRARENEFLSQILQIDEPSDELNQKTLSRPVMEWFLVNMGIFNPQI